MTRTSIDRDSIEYLRVPVSGPAGVDLSTLVMKIAVTTAAVRPVTGDFVTATWDAATNEAKVLVGPLVTPGVRAVWLKITSTPEIPVMQAGAVAVT